MPEGSENRSTIQSNTWVSSSVHAGLVAHNIPCTPRPSTTATRREWTGPSCSTGKIGEEVGRLPVGDARQENFLEVAEHGLERLSLDRRGKG